MSSRVDGAEADSPGNARRALMEAAETIVGQRGLQGFSLRACAAMAGVSPAAPAYHFGNAAGLLEAVAVAGFDDLTGRLQRALAGLDGHAPQTRLAAMAKAYVGFALEQEGRFKITTGSNPVPSASGNPALIAASERAFALLSKEVAGLPGDRPAADEPDRALAVWSFVHGLACLLADRRMTFLVGNADPDALMRRADPVIRQFEMWLTPRGA